jgi:uncharacterized protein (TIGR02266 family)
MADRSTRIEQRVATRIPIRVKVEYTQLSDFLDDYASNLSLGGMFLQSDDPLPVGTRFRLRFRVPGESKSVETYGIVRWVIPAANANDPSSGMGIQFDDLKPTDQASIDRWMQENPESSVWRPNSEEFNPR